MFSLMVGITATSLAASVGIGLARSKQRQKNLGGALGRTAKVSEASAIDRRAMREFATVDRRIRERSPHLSAAQRRELALNLVRARGLLPEGSGQVE